MVLIYFFGFFVLVSVYAVITSKLNQKAKCNHNWEDEANGALKCSKCNKSIHLQNTYNNEHMAA